jgi:AcrR family transcriptional regulator
VAGEVLLASARSAFAASGYGGTSLDAIAARIGLRKASLLHRFPTKQALYGAVLAEIVLDLGALVRGAGLEEGDFVERLDRLGELIVRHLDAHPDAAPLLLREVLDRGPFLRDGGRDAMLEALEAATAFLAAGMEAGVFVRQEPRQLVLSIAGLHLLYPAAGDVAAGFLSPTGGASAPVERRVEAVLAHVRRLVVGAPARVRTGRVRPGARRNPPRVARGGGRAARPPG